MLELNCLALLINIIVGTER